MNIDEAIKWLEKAQVILARQAQEESKIVGRSERNESLQYHMAIQCILEEYEKQQDRINKAIEYIEIMKNDVIINKFHLQNLYTENNINALLKILKGE